MTNTSLFQELEKLLRMESRYCSEDGVLLKNSIIEAALAKLSAGKVEARLSTANWQKQTKTSWMKSRQQPPKSNSPLFGNVCSSRVS